ncbi:DUF2244 domain-containing protein [Ruegeria arenilitoris]|uniref:DUF2244 domain-containing protein n=1 Tax=Ruegeria arenilitoris TaxID=1173585 RepID=UPI00147DB0A2|nr:DUF2244 domain-containing protein [Ruegeria arenilitoris]
MPYQWKDNTDGAQELRLWAHNSLPPRGAMGVVLALFVFGLIPLFAVLGSVLLWGLLPFMLVTVLGLWLAFEMNYKSRDVTEILTLSDTQAHLVHHSPRKGDLEWSCNRYWTRPEMHAHGGPVPNYITLTGEGRQVEIGSFLSEEERVALYEDLVQKLRAPAA